MPDETPNITGVIAALTSAFVPATAGAELAAQTSNVFTTESSSVLTGATTNTTIANAYLNYVVFNQSYDAIASGHQKIGGTINASQLLGFNNITISQKGSIYIWVSNESNYNLNVYFDDLKVTHLKGPILQEDHYYPFGANINALSSTAPLSKPNRFKLSGNEEQTEFDLNVYDFNARTYDPALGRFMNIDPMADQFYNLTPYNYVENNPLRFIDPDGMLSTEVEENEDGTYKVVGGDADDGDNGIYVRNEDGGRGELVGYSATPESFYYSEKDEWKGTIDPNDQSGRNFLNKDILQDNPSLLKYAPNATKNGKYDFKSTNGTDEVVYDDPEDFYRGMPILDKKNGKPIFASARDIGNISGGIIAGRGGRGWAPSRLAFDALESYQKGGFTGESTSTQYGEKLGHRIGSQIYLKETASRFPGNGHLRSIKISKDVIKKGDL